MDWLNLHTSTLDSPEFLGSDPVERSTWLCLLRFCIGQENGGRIALAAEWKDRQWQQVVRVTLREVRRPARLWNWTNGDLIVAFYPSEKEAEVRRNRENGHRGGRPKGNQVVIPNDNPDVTTRFPLGSSGGNPDVSGRFVSAETEGKGREGKGRERNEEGIAPAAPARVRPTLAMVEEYCAERGNGVDPEAWIAHYEANGWKVGRNPMKDWKAAVRTWETGDRKPGARKASGDGMCWDGPLPSPEEARRALGLSDG